MNEIFLPTLHTFENDNIFTGSHGPLRFRAKPNIVKKSPKEVDMEQSTITVEFWHGLFCYEKSTMEGKQTFPMSMEGLDAMRAWLWENK